MTGRIFTACINSTDPLIPLLGPSGGPNASATWWCITVGVTNIFGLEVLVVCWFTDDMSLGCLKRLIIALCKREAMSQFGPCCNHLSLRESYPLSDIVIFDICGASQQCGILGSSFPNNWVKLKLILGLIIVKKSAYIPLVFVLTCVLILVKMVITRKNE